jgi:hypothetical protein
MVQRMPEDCQAMVRYGPVAEDLRGEKTVALLTDHGAEWERLGDGRLEPSALFLFFLAQLALAPTVVIVPTSHPELDLEKLGSGWVLCDFIDAEKRANAIDRNRLEVVKKTHDKVWLARYEGKSK